MSVIQFFLFGGMATISGDLPEDERKEVNKVIKSFGEKIKRYALDLQVPASLLTVQQCGYLLVGRDIANYHIVFANANTTTINYYDYRKQVLRKLSDIVGKVRMEIGDVVFAFSLPTNISDGALDDFIQKKAEQYVNTILHSQKQDEKITTIESTSSLEIASGLEKFRLDFPSGNKTAFIMMQFNKTKLHGEIVDCIRETLKKRSIIALRSDDKEYMDDLFPNVKIYMHACNFGIAIFDRITEEDFNPNVSLEVGYMLGMGKNVLLLKDKT